MKLKRIVSLMLALLLSAVCFAGCSGSNNTDSKENESSDEVSETASFPKYDFDTKTVKVCIDWSENSSWVQGWENSFKKRHPDVNVEYMQATPQEKASKLAIWYATDQSPDVVYAKAEEIWPTLYNKDLIQPVNDYIDFKNEFWGSVEQEMNKYQVGGKNYLMLSVVEPVGYVIYNRTTFKNAGLEEPLSLFYKGEWTKDKFEEYAEKLTKPNPADVTKSRYGLFIHQLQALIGITGKDFIEYKDDSWVTNFTDPDITTMVDFIQKVGPTGQKYAWDEDVDPTRARAQTITGQIAMYVTAESPALEFPEQVADGSLSVVPMPMYNKDNGYIQYAYFDSFVIPKGAKNPAAGAAYAAGARAYVYLDKYYESSKEFATETKKMYDYVYASGKVKFTPATFRRLEGQFEYAEILGRVFRNGESYSKVVAEMEPLILNALKSES